MVAEAPEMSNAAARFGAWLVGSADLTGGFPIELTMHQIRNGFTRNGSTVPGMGGRYETIKASISWLEKRGYLSSTEGRAVGFGYVARNYTLNIKK